MKIGKLFIGKKRTNESRPTFVVASWASQRTGYWRWAIYWTPPVSWREVLVLPKAGPCGSMGTKWFGWWGLFSLSAWLQLPLLGVVRYASQPPRPGLM
jgi:hypothetical protein